MHLLNVIFLHRKNDFTEGSKILLDTDLKIILLGHQNNFIGTLKIMSNANIFDILATNLYNIKYNVKYSSNKSSTISNK